MGIKDFSEDEFKVKFRINKKHAKDVMTALQIGPLQIQTDSGHIFTAEESFLVWAFRITDMTRLSTVEDIFHMDYTEVSRIFNHISRFICSHHHLLLFDNLPYFEPSKISNV